MATVNTWRAVQTAVAFAATKDMLDVFNGGAATRVLRVRRMYQLNNGTGAVVGVLTTMEIRRITTATVGTAVTPVAHDTTNSALEAAATAGTGRTITLSDLFRRYLWSNDEPAVSGATQDEWELLIPFGEVWNAGYGDTAVQPVVARANQGYSIYHSGASAVGSNDFEIEFTDEAT